MTPLRLLLSWLVLLAVGFTNGVVRVVGWPRLVSQEAANQIAVATGVVALAGAIWLLTRAWPLASAGQAWRAGLLWCALTVVFETGLGRAEGLGWSRIFAEYRFWEGRLWPLMLATILVAPRLAYARHSAGTRA